MIFSISKKKLTYFLICFCLIFLYSKAQAHPHSWISLKTEVVGDDTHILGFNMSWTFDTMTSAYMLDGEDLSAANKSKTLNKIAKSVMGNLNVEHYFSYFYDGNTPIKYAFSNQAELKQNKTKLTLVFFLPLSKPKEIENKSFKLLVFEPSYYVDMSWENKSDIQLSPELAQHCSLALIQPNPTPEQMTYAMSLGVEEKGDDALGQLFTQTVNIQCHQ